MKREKKTVIALFDQSHDMVARARITLTDKDATTQAIANAVIELVTQVGMSLHAGNQIKIYEE